MESLLLPQLQDENGKSLIDPPVILSYSSPSNGSIGVEVTTIISASRQAKASLMYLFP